MRLDPIEGPLTAAAVTPASPRMRVLILTADLAPGNWSGIGVAAAAEARNLAAAGAQVVVLRSGEVGTLAAGDVQCPVPKSEGPGAPGEDEASGVRVLSPVPKGEGPGAPGSLLQHQTAWVPPVPTLRPGREEPTEPHWEGVDVRRLPTDRFPSDLPRFDRIHLHSLALAPLALEAARRWSVPLLYTAHMLLSSEIAQTDPAASTWIDVQRKVFRAADHVRFLNRAERERAVALNPGLRARSSVQAHGIEPAADPIAPAAARQPLIVFSGRFCSNKGADIAAQAIALALARLPGWTALIAGGHGEPGCTKLIEAIAGSGGRIHAPGWLAHHELQRAIARAALVVIPSRYEPFGLAALEALRAGTPVLATDTGGLAEILRPDCGVLLLPSAGPAQWADAIVALAADLPLRQSLAAAGLDAVHRRFHPLVHARALLGLLPSASFCAA